MRNLRWLVMFAFAVLPAPGQDGALDTAPLQLIPQRMQEAVERGEISGVVTLVGRNGRIVALDAAGFSDVEKRTPMRTDSIVQIMSQTKSVTGVAAMILVDEGRLDLTRPVSDYLPEFKGMQVAEKLADGTISTHPPKHAPMVWELMCHTSGLAFLPDSGEFARINYTLDHTLAEAVRGYATEHLLTEPGTAYRYSNMGIATLGRIVEVIAGEKYEDFVRRRILEPLEMKDTFFFPPADRHARIAMVYRRNPEHKLEIARGAQGGDPARFRAGAKYAGPELALFSTATDLFHFYSMLAARGVYNGKRVLSPQAVEAMVHDYTPDHSGYGLTVSVAEGTKPLLRLLNPGAFGHGGAFGTSGMVDAKNGLVMVFLPQMDGESVAPLLNAFTQLAESSVR